MTNKKTFRKLGLTGLLALLLCLPLAASVEGETVADALTDAQGNGLVPPAACPAADTPAGVTTAAPPLTVPAFVIPDNELIRKFRDQYTTPEGLKYLSAIMKRSVPYRDFISEEISLQEVPSFLLYLPVIESGYSVTAVSRSGATGMWQFMRNSVGGYNIRINEWMDERRDPWITSKAAIKKLKENYNYLGDWYLALAAYNCGLGATQNAIKKGGKADYWYLCEKGFFKKETVLYVPKLLAIADILSNSAQYGIDLGDTATNLPFVTVDVKRALDINLLAKETGIDPSILKTANPALFYHITPPNMAYALRVPSDQETMIRSVLEDKTRLLLEYYMYKIKSGDTLYALALHYGITADMILEYNPGLKASTLKIGKNLVIPALKQIGAYTGKKDPDTLDFSGTYLVKQGDSLWSISLAYNIQVETLAEKNNLEVNSVLKLGKVLRVPIL